MAYPVMQRARAAVERYNRDVRRSSFVKTEIRQRECGDFTVQMSLNDEVSDLLRLELMAPTQKQAHRLAGAFSRNAETIYRLVMDQLLSEEKENSWKNTACCRARTGLSSKLIFATCMFRQKVV